MEDWFYSLRDRIISSEPYIIGVDGLGGSGKSTFAKILKEDLSKEGYDSCLLHMDDFIYPKNIRYDETKKEWDCYLNAQWRYDYLVDEILTPIKNGMVLDKNIEIYDRETDRYDKKMFNSKNGIVILEGIFIQRNELRNYLDFVIYIDVPKDIRLNRVLERDTYIGDVEEIKNKYCKRYFPAEERYLEKYLPIENADVVLRNI